MSEGEDHDVEWSVELGEGALSASLIILIPSNYGKGNNT